jgi:hypothetical protein
MGISSASFLHKIVAMGFFILLASSLIAVAFLNSKWEEQQVFAQSSAEGTWKKYSNFYMGIEVSYPPSWYTDTEFVNEMHDVTLFSDFESDSDLYEERLIVTVEKLPEGTTLSEYTDFIETYITMVGIDSDAVEDTSSITLSGYPGKVLVATSHLEEEDFDEDLKSKVVWTVVEDRAYVLYSYAQEDRYADFLATFDEIIGSFKITDTSPPDNPAKFTEYSDDKNGFSVEYDIDWELVTDSETCVTDDIVIAFNSPFHGYAYYGAYADIVKSDVASSETLIKYTDSIIDENRDIYYSFRLLESEKTELSGQDAHEITFTWSQEGKLYKSYEVWALYAGQAYVLYFVTDEEIWDYYEDKLDHMVSTFEITGAPENTSPDDGSLDASLEFTAWKNSDYGIELQYPDSWIVYEPEGLAVGFTAPSDSDDDSYFETVIVGAEDSTLQITLDEVTKASIANIKSASSNFVLSKSEAATLDGHPAHYVLGTARQDGVLVQIYSIWTLVENRQYFMIFVGEPDMYDEQYSEIVQQMVDSFKIDETKLETGYVLHSNKELGVGLQYPGNWELKETSEFRSPTTISLSDKSEYRFLTVTAVPVLWGLTSEEYAKTLPEQLSEEFDSFRLVDTTAATLSGLPAHKIVFTGYIKAPETILPDVQPVAFTTASQSIQVKAALIVAVKDSVAYSVLYGTTATGYLTFIGTANKMVESIDIDTNVASTKIRGSQYSDDSSNLELTLPTLWSGHESSVGNSTTIIMTPSGSGEEKTSIVVIIENLTQVLEEDSDEESACSSPKESHIVRVSGDLKMEWVDQDCKIYGEDAKTRNYVAYTEDYMVAISLLASNEDSFDQALPALEQVIQSASLDDSIDPFSTEKYDSLFGVTTLTETVAALNGTYPVIISTDSNVTGVAFDEAQKRLAVNVTAGSDGFTSIVVSRILEGPYTVMLDDEVTEDYLLIHDETQNETSISVSYPRSLHEISVTGATVVPEFPLPILLVVSSLAAIIVATRLGRAKHTVK